MRETEARQAALADRTAAAVRLLARACGAIGLPGLAAEAAAADAALAAAVLDDRADGAGAPAAAEAAEEEDYCIGGGVPPKRRRTLAAPAHSTPPPSVKAEGEDASSGGGWGMDAEAECASLGFLGGSNGASAAVVNNIAAAAAAAAAAAGDFPCSGHGTLRCDGGEEGVCPAWLGLDSFIGSLSSLVGGAAASSTPAFPPPVGAHPVFCAGDGEVGGAWAGHGAEGLASLGSMGSLPSLASIPRASSAVPAPDFGPATALPVGRTGQPDYSGYAQISLIEPEAPAVLGGPGHLVGGAGDAAAAPAAPTAVTHAVAVGPRRSARRGGLLAA